MIVRSNSIGPLYMMRLPGSLTPSSNVVAALAAVPHTLTAIAPTTWHRRLGHPGPNTLSSLSRSSFIQCTGKKHGFCHACQLGKHTLPFCSSSHHAKHPFDLIHLDLWTSSVVSVSDSKYYLVILDDFTHYLWTFPLNLNMTPSLLCSISFPMCLLNSVGLSKLSNVTTDGSLTTLPPASSSCRTTHSFGCCVLTCPHKRVKLNVLFIQLIMSFALC
jgi:hypothetical protein